MPNLSFIPTRWLLAALVAGIALSNGAGIATAATPSRAARADVRHLLAPVHRLNRAVDARSDQLDQLTADWSATARPCIDRAYAGIDQHASGGRRTELYNVFSGLVLWEAGQQWTPPLDQRLAAVEHRYATMHVKDRRLRAAARAKARQFDAWRAGQAGDLCALVDQWASTGYDEASVILLDPNYSAYALTLVGHTGRAVDRGAQRLHHLGASAQAAATFDVMPLMPLGQGGIDLIHLP